MGLFSESTFSCSGSTDAVSDGCAAPEYGLDRGTCIRPAGSDRRQRIGTVEPVLGRLRNMEMGRLTLRIHRRSMDSGSCTEWCRARSGFIDTVRRHAVHRYVARRPACRFRLGPESPGQCRVAPASVESRPCTRRSCRLRSGPDAQAGVKPARGCRHVRPGSG